MIRWRIYRIVMKLAHRFNWHYAPPIYPDGDTQLWCQWCGFRDTIKSKTDPFPISLTVPLAAESVRKAQERI